MRSSGSQTDLHDSAGSNSSSKATKYVRLEGRMLREREYIGAECMFKPGTCDHTISSVEFSQLLSIGHKDIESLHHEFPDIAEYIKNFIVKSASDNWDSSLPSVTLAQSIHTRHTGT